MSRVRRRGRRGKTPSPPLPEVIEAQALQVRHDESEQKLKRRGEALTPQQQENVHRWIAVATVLRMPVAPFVRAQWRACYETELRTGVEKYYCVSKAQAARRLAYLDEAMSDPELVVIFGFPYYGRRMHEGYEGLSKEVLIDVKFNRVLVDGEWTDKRVDILRDREELRPKYLAENRMGIQLRHDIIAKRMELERLASNAGPRPIVGDVSLAACASDGGIGKATPIHGAGSDGAMEDQSTDPAVAALLVQQEGIPFAPMAEAHSSVAHEQKAKDMRRWAKEQEALPESEHGRPTRIVRKDGDVVILDTDSKLSDGPVGPDELATPAPTEVDDGAALLATEEEIERDYKADEGPTKEKD